MIHPKAKPALIQLLTVMQAEAEHMVEDFEREPWEDYQTLDTTQQAIAAIASKQAAMCTLLKLLVED